MLGKDTIKSKLGSEGTWEQTKIKEYLLLSSSEFTDFLAA
jgi:hypothetical protein